MGYFASGKGKILALHDADILNYRSEMLARLLYPLANPTFGYAFCKGYYFRTDSDGFNGRVARLLVTPLLRAMKQILGEDDFLTYPIVFATRWQVSSQWMQTLSEAFEFRLIGVSK